MKKQRLLFVCTGNINRSKTAEDLFANSSQFEAKSAGIEQLAAVRVSQELVDWADIIFVMDERTDGHLAYLRKQFVLGNKPVYDLEIGNSYRRGDPELIRLLKNRLQNYRILAD